MEIRTNLRDIEAKLKLAQTAFADSQFTHMTSPITAQEDPRRQVRDMTEDMQRELTRIDGEITKHSQFENSQFDKLEAGLKGMQQQQQRGAPH